MIVDLERWPVTPQLPSAPIIIPHLILALAVDINMENSPAPFLFLLEMFSVAKNFIFAGFPTGLRTFPVGSP